jgi:hypothetical protein
MSYRSSNLALAPVWQIYVHAWQMHISVFALHISEEILIYYTLIFIELVETYPAQVMYI